MKKAYIIRCIFWGFILLITLSLGIFGLIYHNRIFESNKDDLNRIVEIFNNSQTVKEYTDRKIYVTASLDGKNIKIKYPGSESKEYTYKLKNGYIETTYNENDSIARVMLMILTDSIAVNKGNMEKETYKYFNDNSIYNYKLKDGIEFSLKNNTYKVKINIKNTIKNSSNNYQNDSI